MNGWLFHSYAWKVEERHERVLSIFIAYHTLLEAELDGALTHQLSRAASFDAVHIVGYSNDIETVRDWLLRSDSVLISRLRSIVRHQDDALRFFEFDQTLGIHIAKSLSGKSAPIGIIAVERQLTLFEVFKGAGAEQVAPVGTHYVKTSESHSDRFLRVSNVLEHGANVRLVAFWLLPYFWNTSAQQVIVDTSGIYSVALTVVHEATSRGGLHHQPLVWSHRSHDGVDQIPPEDAAGAVFLVSASTSGGLVKRIAARGANLNRVITLPQQRCATERRNSLRPARFGWARDEAH